MLYQKDNISYLNQYMNSNKLSHIIYANLESLIEKIDGCANNPEKSSTTKIVSIFFVNNLGIWSYRKQP